MALSGAYRRRHDSSLALLIVAPGPVGFKYAGTCPMQKGDHEVAGIDIVFKVAGIGIISIVIALIFEQVGRKDFAWAATVIGAVLVFGVALLRFKELLDEILTVFRLW